MSDETRRVRIVFTAEDKTGGTGKKIVADANALNLTFADVRKSARLAGQAIRDVGSQGSTGLRRVAAAAKEGRQQIIGMVSAGRGLVTNLKNVGLAGLGLSAVVGAAREAARAIADLSHESLTAQQQAQNLQIDISGARTAFKGYVDDVTLAKTANQAFALGVVKTGEEFARLSAGIQAKSEQLGISSDQLLSQAVLAIGRGSAKRLDDLGIILNQTKAEKMYAKTLGKTVKQLTRAEKAAAFRVVAFELVAVAGESATREIDGFAVSVVKAEVALRNAKQGLLGFEDTAGKVRDALRGLTREQLDRLSFGEVADDASAAGRELNKMLGKWGVGLRDVRGQADKLGVEYQQLIKGARQALVNEDTQFIEQFIANSLADRVEARNAEADEIEHTSKLLSAMGEDQSVVLAAQLESLEVRRDAALMAEKETEALAIGREIELLRAKADAPKKGGGGGGPSRGDRVGAAGEARVAALEQEAKILELTATTSGERVLLEEAQRDAVLARLDLELQVLEATRARGEVGRQEQAAERQAIEAQVRIVGIEAEIQARSESNRLVAEAVALSTQRSEAEANASGRVISMEQFRLRAQEQQLMNTGRLEQAARVRVALIEAEARAVGLRFEAREAELRAVSPETESEQLEQADELAQLVHDREMQRLETESQLRGTVAAEKQRLAEEDTARLQQQSEQLKAWIGSTQQAMGSVTNFAQQMIGRRNQAADAEHGAKMKRLQDSGKARDAGFEAQIKAAKAQGKATNSIEKARAKNEQATQLQVQQAEAAHQERRKRGEMRFQGAMLLIQAAVSVARAAAAYPVIPSMVAHAAAAAVNAAMGATLLAGNIPGAGGAGAGATGAGAGAGRVERDTSEAPTTPESVPAADSSPQDRTGSPSRFGGGGGVVIHGDVNAWGSIDDDVAESIAISIDNVRAGREAAS